MRLSTLLTGLCVLLAGGRSEAKGAPQGASPAGVRALDRDDLKITEGRLERGKGGRLRVECAKMRAVAPGHHARVAELRFTYLGPSVEQAALESGQMRRQIGLKLRAQDGCNLVYVMWRIEPKAELMVSTKINPGMHESRECGAGGYKNLRPRKGLALGSPGVGVPHVLRAEMQERQLKVFVDGALAWDGEVEAAALQFDGPAGVRSDNGRFDFQLLVGP